MKQKRLPVHFLAPATFSCRPLPSEALSSVVSSYGYSMMAAIARTISSKVGAETCPNFRMNRCLSIPRNCNVSTAETLVRPLARSGSIRTCQILGAKYSFQSVMGATNLIGRRPAASEPTTTAGRVFWISAPTVGSKLTSQISPRRGVAGLGFDNIAALPRLALSPL